MSPESNQEIVDSFPYENYHSCRLTEPNYPDYAYKKCAEKHKGKCIDHNYGIRGPGKSELQALRYSKTIWTASDAGTHCKSRGGSFEPAKKAKEKQTIPSADLDNPAKNPFVFNMPGMVEFAAAGEDGQKNKIRLTLYDGSVVKHWYWGNLAFELSTMRMAKKRNPILFTHDVSQRAAVSDTAEFDPKFIMEGDFLKSSKIAEEIKAQMTEGFPFEASLRFDPDRSKIEFVNGDETIEVNGNKLKGPGTVIKNACILEGSICVFGALKNTQSEAFEIVNNLLREKESIMDEQTTLTLDTFAEQYPELHSQLVEKARQEGGKATMELFNRFVEKFGDDPVFCIEHFKKGGTLEQTTEIRIEKLKVDNQQLSEQLKKQAKTRIDPAAQEFSDQQNASGGTGNPPPPEKPEDKYAKEFNKSQEIQDEFGGPEGIRNYIAFRKAEDAGKVRG
jgi:hypothetical protein